MLIILRIFALVWLLNMVDHFRHVSVAEVGIFYADTVNDNSIFAFLDLHSFVAQLFCFVRCPTFDPDIAAFQRPVLADR